jgi:ABC-type spermidine/putrescine transport system permease subunit I
MGLEFSLDLFLTSILLGLTGYWLFQCYTAAIETLSKTFEGFINFYYKTLPEKPFQCSFCMTFWMVTIITIAAYCLGYPVNLLTLLSSSGLAIYLERRTQ